MFQIKPIPILGWMFFFYSVAFTAIAVLHCTNLLMILSRVQRDRICNRLQFRLKEIKFEFWFFYTLYLTRFG